MTYKSPFKDRIFIRTIAPTNAHAKWRLRAERNSHSMSILGQLYNEIRDKYPSCGGKIHGPYGDGRYRLQFYGEMAFNLAAEIGWFETDKGKRYAKLMVRDEIE